jgi:hypothetical protein
MDGSVDDIDALAWSARDDSSASPGEPFLENNFVRSTMLPEA